jgi:GNAT superfamily N-acetyltransferase
MSSETRYPEAVSGPFPTPPATMVDGADREIEVRPYDDSEYDREAMVAMYEDFDPADRAQGVPPVGESRIRDWLDVLLADGGYNVLAWHGDRVVGHATLVSDGDSGFELAIFVHQEYQGAGIGTALVEHLLGHGAAQGVRRVWLTVERWNRAAMALYERVGFETTDAESFELEMAIRLGED